MGSRECPSRTLLALSLYMGVEGASLTKRGVFCGKVNIRDFRDTEEAVQVCNKSGVGIIGFGYISEHALRTGFKLYTRISPTLWLVSRIRGAAATRETECKLENECGKATISSDNSVYISECLGYFAID